MKSRCAMVGKRYLTEKENFEICRKYNAQIKTKEDLDDFLKRVVNCDQCKKVFYDKPCPECRRKEIGMFEKEAQEEQIKEIRDWLLNYADFGTFIVKLGKGKIFETKLFVKNEFDKRFEVKK